jgi:hypothetical protein
MIFKVSNICGDYILLRYHAMQTGRDMEKKQRKMPSFSFTLKMEASGASRS